MDRRDGLTSDEVLREHHDFLVTLLTPSLGEEQAIVMADAAVADLAYRYGGQQVYFQLRSPYIAKAIVAQFTGGNISDLVQRFRLSRGTIYKILQKEREAKRVEQGRLPGC